jgi:small subunit ribosomal protein S17
MSPKAQTSAKKSIVPAQPAEERAARKVREGVVISNKMQKTIVVRVVRHAQHGTYGRVINRSTSFKAHDEKNEAKPGDLVLIMETRPLSKDKRWRLLEIVRKASLAPPVPGAEESKGKKAAAEGARS